MIFNSILNLYSLNMEVNRKKIKRLYEITFILKATSTWTLPNYCKCIRYTVNETL